MRIHDQIARLAAALAVSVAAISCSGPSQESAKPSAPQDVSLRLKWVFDPGFAGELVAALSAKIAETLYSPLISVEGGEVSGR